MADVENISVSLSAAGSAGFSVYLAEYTDKAEAEKANENLLSGTIPSGDNVASATLTAESYFVTLDYNNDATPDAKYASNGQSFTIPGAAPTRSGYVFRGWNDGTTTYQPGETVNRITASTTLTAQWQDVDEVKIAWFPPALPPSLTSSSWSSAKPGSDGKVLFTLVVDPAYIPSTPQVTVNGDPIIAEIVGSGNLFNYTFNVSDYADQITVKLVGGPSRPVVSFDSNGGSQVEQVTVNFNGKLTRPADPTWAEHTFLGWYKDPALTQPWDFDNDVVTGNITLYAKWSLNTYSVEVVPAPHGVVTASPSGGAAGTEITLTAVSRGAYKLDSLAVVNAATGAPVALTKVDGSTYTFDMPSANVRVYYSFEPIVQVPDTYDIVFADTAHGSARASLSNASAGSRITVVASPDEGYVVGSVDVVGPGGRVDVERLSSGVYVFTMPAGDVEVSVSFTRSGLPFLDVRPGAWYYDAVSCVWSEGLMQGTSELYFEPDAGMTRAMFWAVLARIDGQDVTGAGWKEAARSWAVAESVSDGTGPDELITREQMVTMLYRFQGSPAAGGMAVREFSDSASVSAWASDAVNWALASGVLTGMGDGTLAPQGHATRAQAAAMFMRLA